MPTHLACSSRVVIVGAITAAAGLPVFAGTLSFYPPEDLDAYRVSALAVADFDGDGALDMFAARPFTVWRNERDGTFSEIGLGPSDEEVFSIAVGDTDGDGDLDVACSQFGSNLCLSCPPTPPLRMFRNDGDMSFLGSSREVYGDQWEVVIADFDGDPWEDVATLVTQYAIGYDDGDLRIVPALGSSQTHNGEGNAMAAGDVDGDGDVDIVTTSTVAESEGVWLWRNNGNGGFGRVLMSSSSQLVMDVKLAPLDGDSDLDAVLYSRASYPSSTSTVTVMRNNGSSFAVADTLLAYPNYGPHGATGAGDLDQDGDVDLVLVEASGVVRCQLNNGNAVFSSPQSAGLVPVPPTDDTDEGIRAVEVADIDDDTDLDIVVGGDTGLFVLRNRLIDCGIFGGRLGDGPCADTCRFEWAGTGAALTDATAWTPVPIGSAEDGDLVLHNDGVPTNVATLAQPFAACQLTVQGSSPAERQYVRVDAGGELEVGFGALIEAHGVVQLNGGTMTVHDELLNIAVDGELTGKGTATGLYKVNGLLAADHNATLAVTAPQNVYVTITTDVDDQGVRFEIARGKIEVGLKGILDLDTEDGLGNLGDITVTTGGFLDVSSLGDLAAISNGGDPDFYSKLTVSGGNVVIPPGKTITNLRGGVIISEGNSSFQAEIVNHGEMQISPGSGDTETRVYGCITNTNDPNATFGRTGVNIRDNATLRVDCFMGDAAVGRLCFEDLPCDPPSESEGAFAAEPLGNGTLVVDDDLVLASEASLLLPHGTVRVGGDVDIAINDGERLDLSEGVLQLDGFYFDGPQHLELMSPDVGQNVPEGDAAARVLGELILGPSPTDIVLVDNHDNSGTGTGDTIYVRDLRIEPGAIVDLAGTTVYYDTLTVADPAQQVIDSVGGGTMVEFNVVPCPGDVDGNGEVGFDDLTWLLNVWGPCATSFCPADLTEDGSVSFDDLTELLAGWGTCGG